MTKTHRAQTRIFVIVEGGVAEVDSATVPEGIAVEVIDLDDLAADRSAALKLSSVAQAYARRKGYV